MGNDSVCWDGERFSLVFFDVTMQSSLLIWGTVQSCLSLAVSCTYSTFHSKYRASWCFVKCEVCPLCFFPCVYYCCSWEGKGANGWSLTRILYQQVSCLCSCVYHCFSWKALKLRLPAENLFLLVQLAWVLVVCVLVFIIVLVERRWSYACPPKTFFFWCSWHGCYGWYVLSVGVGFSGPSSTCWFGLITAELVARRQVVWCSE